MPISFEALTWQRQSPAPLAELKAAGAQYHHAAQYLAATGQSYLPSAEDDSHTNLEWLSPQQALAAHWIDERFRLLLNYPDFSLRWELTDGTVARELPLDGLTKAQVWERLRAQLTEPWSAEAAGQYQPIEHYELPSHPLDEARAPFEAPPTAARQALARYRDNAWQVLRAVAGAYPQAASRVRTWPHHFDSAVLLTLATDESGQAAATVGVGLAVPDSLVDDHYYYVSPWRQDGEIDRQAPPSLEVGQWLPKDWLGAVLPMAELNELPDASRQRDALLTFLDKTISSWIERLS